MAINGAILDPNSDLFTAITSMEMGRLVVVVIHRDNNPKESRDFRHGGYSNPFPRMEQYRCAPTIR